MRIRKAWKKAKEVLKHAKFESGSITTELAKGTINKDGSIEIQFGEFGPFAEFLARVHTAQPCIDLPGYVLTREKGITKHHAKLNGKDFSGDTWPPLYLAAAKHLLSHTSLTDTCNSSSNLDECTSQVEAIKLCGEHQDL